MPQAQAFDQSGKPIADADLPQALASGQALFEEGAQVKMRNPAGDLVGISPKDVLKAQAAGFGLESAEGVAREELEREHSGLGSAAIAGVEGAARGATFGLSDVALAGALGDEYRQGAAARQEFNPVAAGLGEAAGAIAPIIASGGTGAAAKGVATAGLLPRAVAGAGSLAERGAMGVLAPLAERGALGRAAQRTLALGASGAVEGSAYGVGKAISDATLQDHELTAEKLLAGAGEGALYGGIASGVLGGMGYGLSEGAKELVGREGAKGAAESIRRSAVWRQLNPGKADLRKIVGRKTGEAAEARLASVADEVFNYKLADGRKLFSGARTADEMAGDLALAVEETGEKLGALKQELDAAGARPDMKKWLDRVDAEVLPELKKSLVASKSGQAKAVEQEIERVRARVATTDADLVARDAELQAKGVFKRGPEGEHVPILAAEAQPISFLEADQIRRDLREAISPARPAASGPAPPVAAHALPLERAERLLAEEIADSGQRALEQSGQDPALWKELNSRYANLKDAQGVVENVANASRRNRHLSPSDYAVGAATAVGALAHGNIPALVGGAVSSVIHKAIRERGNAVIAHIADRVARADFELGDLAKRFADIGQKAKRSIVPAVAASLPTRFQATKDAVVAMRDNPQAAAALAGQLAQGAGDQNPELGQAIANTVIGDAQFLAAALPPGRTEVGASLTPLAVTPKTSHLEMQRFMAQADALSDPLGTLKRVASGSPAERAAVEAIKIRRPKLFDALRQEVAKACVNRPNELPFQRRIMLSLLFDFNGDPSFSTNIQSSFTNEQPAQGSAPAPRQNPSKLTQLQGQQMQLNQGVTQS